MSHLSDIEGIGESYSTVLKLAGITSLENLLDTCCNKKGRKEIAEKTGINENSILNWVNRADLARVKGVSTQYADLLEFAGVDTVPELSHRKADNLHTRIVEINDEKKLVRKVPSLTQVEDWVAQAKELPRVVTY